MSRVGQTLLSGHVLRGEGNPYDAAGRPSSDWRHGRAKCSCGALSDPLPSSRQRQQWHREHKDAIRAGAES